MNILKSTAVRYCLMKKRLLKKPSFIAILLCIPLLTFAFSFFAKEEDAGLIRVALASRDRDSYSLSIMEDIAKSSETVTFIVASSPEKAREAVTRGECDCAWILEDDLLSKTKKLAEGESVTLVTSCEGEESTLNSLAKEKIFAAFYKEISYRIYEAYCLDAEASATDEIISSVYAENAIEGELIRFEYEKGGEVKTSEKSYLLSPLRGLLSAVMVLCALAATVFYLCDERDGVYTLFKRNGRYFALFATNLSALSLCAVFVSIALLFSGDYTSFFRESLLLILYILCLSGFSSLLGAVFSRVWTFSIVIPAVTVAALALSPVFVDLSGLLALQILMPSYHYLYSAEGISGILPLLLYFLLSTALSYAAFTLSHKSGRR
ncbi:MAG: hypothetical protein E7647_07530 [Ruminococcaceae bacterium]|nr:hypothetical protein [Oscillospiraceae bacterium]